MSFLSNVGDFFKSNGAGIVGTVVGAIQNRKNRKAMQKENALNRQHDFDVMDYQHDINVADWNMQNAYNAPSAQMQRYQDAGLNPNLIYSQLNEGADVNSTSAQSTPGQPYQYDAMIPELISRMGDSYNNTRQHRENIQYQYDALQAQLNAQYAIAMSNIAASYRSDKLKADTEKEIAKMNIQANNDSQDKQIRQRINEMIQEHEEFKHRIALDKYKIEKDYELGKISASQKAREIKILEAREADDAKRRAFEYVAMQRNVSYEQVKQEYENYLKSLDVAKRKRLEDAWTANLFNELLRDAADLTGDWIERIGGPIVKGIFSK